MHQRRPCCPARVPGDRFCCGLVRGDATAPRQAAARGDGVHRALGRRWRLPAVLAEVGIDPGDAADGHAALVPAPRPGHGCGMGGARERMERKAGTGGTAAAGASWRAEWASPLAARRMCVGSRRAAGGAERVLSGTARTSRTIRMEDCRHVCARTCAGEGWGLAGLIRISSEKMSNVSRADPITSW